MRSLVSALPLAMVGSLAAAAACDPGEVTLYPRDGVEVRFQVEVADDPVEQARGLMHRTELAEDAGMIFVFPKARPARFWMKNTPLPLDILFIGEDGRVVNIAERTTPFSERSIPSEGPVLAVLEINGGLSDELGIGPGTPVLHPAFTAAEEPYRCAP